LRLGGAKAERNWTLQGLAEEIIEPEPIIEELIEQSIPTIPQPQIALPNFPKRRVEIYETDVDFFNLPSHAELETHLAQQTYRQPSQYRNAAPPRSPRSTLNTNQPQSNRDRRSPPPRQTASKASPNSAPKVSSANRSNRSPRQLSPLQQVSKAAIELAEALESILIWVWRSWFPPKRKQSDGSRKYKRSPPSFR
jgi:hypothetical protein